MSNWRDLKLQTKGVVHATFQFDALYHRADGTVIGTLDEPIHVRVHDKTKLIGKNVQSASEVYYDTPKLILVKAELGFGAPDIDPNDLVELIGDGRKFTLGVVTNDTYGYIEVEVNEET